MSMMPTATGTVGLTSRTTATFCPLRRFVIKGSVESGTPGSITSAPDTMYLNTGGYTVSTARREGTIQRAYTNSHSVRIYTRLTNLLASDHIEKLNQ